MLVVTAVAVERDAALAGLTGTAAGSVVGLVGGVGPVAAAVSTARALARDDYELVISAGIAGGFAGRAAIGDAVVGRAARWADLGALTADGFLDLAGLGLAGGEPLRSPVADRTLAALTAAGVPALGGTILTLATMTGTDPRAAELADRHPDAVAEAMEGYGVAWAAVAAGVPWVEIRTVSNAIGRRDRRTWDIPRALAALTVAVAALTAPVRASSGTFPGPGLAR